MANTIQLRHRALTVALLGCLPAAHVQAQRIAPILDFGASSVRYADSVTVSATAVSPTLRIESSNATIVVAGTYSRITVGGWTTQGALAASRFVPLGGRFHAELAGSGGGSAHHDQTRTGQMLGQVRAHFIGAARGVWLGGGLGRTWDGAVWHGLALADAGAWLSNGGATVLATLAPTSVRDAGQPSLRYTDGTAAARWVSPRAELGASLGVRLGRDLLAATGASSTWGNLSGTFWLTGPIALTASAGTYPIDYTQGYPGGRYASVALRVARRPASMALSSAVDKSLAGALGTATPIGPVATFTVGPSANRKHRTIAVRARAVTSVEVTGDFAAWQPVRLTRRRDGQWVATLAIPAGTHEIALRVDGGAWIAPPGLTAIRDEFGGASGLLVIRE
jgi:hypothetical protein